MELYLKHLEKDALGTIVLSYPLWFFNKWTLIFYVINRFAVEMD
jgi:hypothetical protein